MLEDIALWYIFQPEDNIRLISYGFVILGGLTSAAVRKNNFSLPRAPYFAYSCMLLLVSAVSGLIGINAQRAIINGYAWVFAPIDVLASFGIGYVLAIIATARSYDAYGHGRSAPLAFIPLFNLLLLFTPSQHAVDKNRVPAVPLLTGGAGIFTGLVLIVVTIGLLGFTETKIRRMMNESQNDPEMQLAWLDAMLRGQGLDKTLKQTAAEVPPGRIDEVTTLDQVEANGHTLRYQYEVDNSWEFLPISMRTNLMQKNCSIDALRRLIDAGAVIEHFYVRADGKELGTVTVTQEVCG